MSCPKNLHFENSAQLNNEEAQTTTQDFPSSDSLLQPVSTFRTVLPQVMASTAKNLILLDLGMTLAFPTLVIAALLKSPAALHFSENQASWFSSIPYICQPLGSLVSGLVLEPLGRKRAMMLVNAPHILAWLLLYRAQSLLELYAAAVIMGLGVGFMEAPILTYVGEISQPRWRSVLTSYSGIFVTFGYVFVYILGTVTDWRMAAATCCGIPILAILLISQVPESPIWLLSKNRIAEAERSLCWLRGWVSPDLVQTELSELKRHNCPSFKTLCNRSENIYTIPLAQEPYRSPQESAVGKSFSGSYKTEQKEVEAVVTNQTDRFLAALRLKELCRRQTAQPLLLVTAFFAFHHAAGITSTRPYLFGIFKEFGSPMDAKIITVTSSVVGLVGNVICMLLVRRAGKKLLSLLSLGACAAFNLTLCITGFFLPESFSLSWISITVYVLLTLSWNCGMGQVPWMLTSEVFPLRARAAASGLSAAASYIMGFIVTKTYLNLYNWLSLPGVFGVYGVFSVIGCVYVYLFLPETEGKSLEEVEKILEAKFSVIRMKVFGSSRKSENQMNNIIN